MECLDENTVLALFRGALPVDRVSAIDAHIDRCASCRALVSNAARREDVSGPVTSPREESASQAFGADAPGAATRWEPGTHFGDRFEIVAFVRAGGMGEVYRARDLETGAAVAIKVVQNLADEDLARFQREAALLAKLSHPAIVRYVGQGLAPDASPFFAMEWLDGEDLAQRLERGHLTADEVRQLGTRLAAALGAAHGAGAVHRDIKPSNIFLCDRDVRRATILDFGIAHMMQPGEMATITRTGAFLGTIAYMAPEQARGAKTVDARADIFSLGCVLYECLTGKRPFVGKHAFEVVAKILADPVAPPSSVEPDIPRALDALVVRMLAKSPADRPADCAHVMDALWAEDRAIEKGPPSRRTLLSWIAAIAVCAIATPGILRVAASPRVRAAIGRQPAANAPTPRAPFHPVHSRRITSGEECAEFPAFSPDSRAIFYDATVGANSFIFTRDLDGGPRRQLTDVSGWDMAPAVSPDGERIAFMRLAGGTKTTLILDRQSHAAPRVLASGTNTRPSWSRDGRFIWTGDDKRIERYDAQSGALVETIPLPAGTAARNTAELPGGALLVGMPPFKSSGEAGIALYGSDRTLSWLLRGEVDEVLATSPDGARVITARMRPTGDSELLEVPLDGSAPTSLASTGVSPRKGLDLSADGHHVAWSTCDAVSELVTVEGADRTTPLLPGWEWDETDIAPIPNTNRAVVLSWRGGIAQPWIVDLDGAATPRAIDVGDASVTGLSVSDDGKWLAFSVFERSMSVVPIDGTAPPRAVTTTKQDFPPSFVHGTHDIVFHTMLPDGRPQIQKVSIDGGEPVALLDEVARAPIASPTDDRIAYLAGETIAQLVPMLADPKTGRRAPLSPTLRPGPYQSVRFSPDGRHVVVTKSQPEQIEVDVASGAIVRRWAFDVVGAAFVRGKMVFAKRHWAGDIWMADEPFSK